MVMKDSAQKELDLHQGVGEQLTHLKQPTQTVPPTEKAIPLTEELKQVGVDATHIIGSKLEELTTGTTPSTEVRGTKTSNFGKFFKRRMTELWK